MKTSDKRVRKKIQKLIRNKLQDFSTSELDIMTESFAKKLCCPIDKSDLDMKIFAKQEDGEIIEALLTCTSCRRYYPVIYGIPIMTPDEYRDKAIEGEIGRAHV